MSAPKIYLSPPKLNGKEVDYIREALDSNWIAPAGPHLDLFEKKLADHAGVKQSLAVNSGTAAIHLALLALGVKAGDEVICPTFTFAGSCNPIFYCNAVPVFVDSEMETWNMDPALMAKTIENRYRQTARLPKAIIVVHIYGMPAKMDEIMSVARRFGIPVIEDAAEAVGSMYKGRPVGSIGDLGVYSFNGNKIITTSGGGALLSSNEEWMERARYLSNQAKESSHIHYEHKEVGYNYRLSNLCAAVGLAQLETLTDRVRERREVFDSYKRALTDFVFQGEPVEFFSNRWLTSVMLPDRLNRDEVLKGASSNGIEMRSFWKPLHTQYGVKAMFESDYPVANELFKRGVSLPFSNNVGISNWIRRPEKEIFSIKLNSFHGSKI